MKTELVGIKKEFNGKTVLDIDYLLFQEGKIYGVLGPNGSGKTTMFRIIAGIENATSGRVFYNGDVKPNKNIAYMPQNTYMFDMTVLENVLLGLKNLGIDNNEAKYRAKSALASVGMEDFLDSRARFLSGGEAQRVALARTLALARDLVLLDEPTSALDVIGVELVNKYIKTINQKEHCTIVYTTHNPSQVVQVADEIIIMDSGRIIAQESPQTLSRLLENQGWWEKYA